MSTLLRPLSGYMPTSLFADRVVGPPTALLSAGQLREASNDPLSFRFSAGRRARVSHEQAADWLAACEAQGALRAFGPALLVYRQTGATASATGLIADISLPAYSMGSLKRHEGTIARTERKMAKYMRKTRFFGNPIALAHRPHPAVTETIAIYTRQKPGESFETVDGVRHELWFVSSRDTEELVASFNGPLYVTDGHHRLAAALLVAAEDDRTDAYMPAGLFATTELRVAAFARCVTDPSINHIGVTAQLAAEHELEEVSPSQARPSRRFEYGAKIGDRYFRLRIHPDAIPPDPYEALDVNLLQNLILRPVFGIKKQGGDKRLRFVADTAVTAGEELAADAWFLPAPASIEDVMRVADSGRVMPQKSTWFGPKLPSGLVIRAID